MSLITKQNFFDLDPVFDRFFGQTAAASTDVLAPKVDIHEHKKHFLITADMPGVEKDDIHITVDNGWLSLEAHVEQENKEEQDGKLIRQERRYGSYARSFSVGSDVKPEDIKADFKKGVLKITVPKLAEPQPTKTKVRING